MTIHDSLLVSSATRFNMKANAAYKKATGQETEYYYSEIKETSPGIYIILSCQSLGTVCTFTRQSHYNEVYYL